MIVFGMLKKTFAAFALAAMLAGGAPSAAQQSGPEDEAGLAPTDTTDIRTLTCWEVVTLTEDDRAFAMSLLYGYAKGTSADAMLSPRNVQVAIVNSMMRCVDEPDALVLNMLQDHIANEE